MSDYDPATDGDIDDGPRPARIGDRVDGRYALEYVLGESATGRVFLARDLEVEDRDAADAYVAVRVLDPSLGEDEAVAQALLAEALRFNEVVHENILGVHEFGADGNWLYIATDLVDGTTLDRVLAEQTGGLDEDEALTLIYECGEALAHAHRKGRFGLWFRPGNVFCTSNGARVALGVADVPGAIGTLSKHRRALGEFASPEVVTGGVPTATDDVFALAVTACLCLTGRYPYGRVSMREALSSGLEPTRIPGLEEAQWQALKRALALDASQRTPDAQRFQREFFGEGSLPRWAVGLVAGLLAAAGAALIYALGVAP